MTYKDAESVAREVAIRTGKPYFLFYVGYRYPGLYGSDEIVILPYTSAPRFQHDSVWTVGPDRFHGHYIRYAKFFADEGGTIRQYVG